MDPNITIIGEGVVGCYEAKPHGRDRRDAGSLTYHYAPRIINDGLVVYKVSGLLNADKERR